MVPGADGLRWGVLAPGAMSHVFASDLGLAGLTIQAVGSRSADRAEEFAREFHAKAAYGSYEDLVADPEVDIVYVASPHNYHREHAELVLRAGKHLLLEKPFTVRADDAHAVVTLARTAGRFVMEGMWTRFLPHMVRTRELIAAGAIGEVRTLLSNHSWNLPDWKMKRCGDPSLAGGSLLEMGVYPIDLAFDIFGPPDSVHAISTPTSHGVDAQTSVLFGYRGGGQAVLNFALDVRGPNTSVVIGTRGRIEMDADWWKPVAIRRYDEDDALVEEYDGTAPGSGYQFEALAVERLVAEGRLEADWMSLSETLAIMDVLDQIREQIGLRYPFEAAPD